MVKVGDKVRSLVTEFDVCEGGIYEVETVGADGAWVIDDVEDDYYLSSDEYEPVAVADSNGNRFKVGDRVRVVRRRNAYGATLTDIEPGEIVTLTDIVDDINEGDWTAWGVAEYQYTWIRSDDIEPAPLTIQSGKFYRTRDGRKVGPATDNEYSFEAWPWNVPHDGGFHGYATDGKSCLTDRHDIIAEWVNADEVDDCNNDYAPSPTTGFTVPLDAPEFGGAESKFKVGDRVHYKDAHCEGVGVIESDNDSANGYGWFVTVEEKDRDHAPFNDNTTRIFTEDKLRLVAKATSGKDDESDAKLLVTISADTSALDAEIDRVLKKLKKLKRRARKLGIDLEYSELRDAA